MDTSMGKMSIPFTNGLEARVIYGGLVAGTMRYFKLKLFLKRGLIFYLKRFVFSLFKRALIETPLEYAKVKGYEMNEL